MKASPGSARPCRSARLFVNSDRQGFCGHKRHLPAQPAGTKELAWAILLPPSASQVPFSGGFGSVPLPFPDDFDEPLPVPVIALDPFGDLVYRIVQVHELVEDTLDLDRLLTFAEA